MKWKEVNVYYFLGRARVVDWLAAPGMASPLGFQMQIHHCEHECPLQMVSPLRQRLSHLTHHTARSRTGLLLAAFSAPWLNILCFDLPPFHETILT